MSCLSTTSPGCLFAHEGLRVGLERTLGHCAGTCRRGHNCAIIRAAWQNWWIQQLIVSGGFRELPGASLQEGDLLGHVMGPVEVSSQTPHPTWNVCSSTASLPSLFAQNFYLKGGLIGTRLFIKSPRSDSVPLGPSLWTGLLPGACTGWPPVRGKKDAPHPGSQGGVLGSDCGGQSWSFTLTVTQ